MGSERCHRFGPAAAPRVRGQTRLPTLAILVMCERRAGMFGDGFPQMLDTSRGGSP